MNSGGSADAELQFVQKINDSISNAGYKHTTFRCSTVIFTYKESSPSVLYTGYKDSYLQSEAHPVQHREII